MRPMKSRALNRANNCWYYGFWGDKYNDYEMNLSCFWQQVQDGWLDPKTVGQSTGLHDKNGKEIYEGDKVKWSWSWSHRNIEGIIKWDDKNLQWIITNTYFEHNRQVPLSNYPVEVIGTIPELIEETNA